MTLRELRRQRLGSLRRASRVSGIPASTLAGWETGDRAVTPEAVARLSEALGASPEDIRRAAPSLPRVPLDVAVAPGVRRWLVRMAERNGTTCGRIVEELVKREVGRV